jgi:hypothetical protein
MGNRKNLPQHGKSNPSPQFKMLKHFTEKNLRGPNQVYVTLNTPTVTPLFRTVVDVACRNAMGQTKQTNIVNGIWANFATLIVNRWDGTGPLLYWGPFASQRTNSGICFTTADLLKYGDGKCGAWASFLQDTISAHGISSVQYDIEPNPNPPYQGFQVYPTTKGQGNQLPLVNLFANHGVIGYGGVIYDPSYGKTYVTQISWQDSSITNFIYNNKLIPETNGVQHTVFNQ